jgi:DNA-directed RNA polymerase specialized sigma24 family protein
MKKYFKDETLKAYEEMAEELNQNVKTVYANNRDALRKAKAKLEKMGFKKEDFFGEDK